MTLEDKIRELVSDGNSLEEVMDSITRIANKIEQEKSVVNSRDMYIKELENSFIEKAMMPKSSRDWEIAGIIMALNYADKVPSASKEDIEDMYDTACEAFPAILDSVIETFGAISKYLGM